MGVQTISHASRHAGVTFCGLFGGGLPLVRLLGKGGIQPSIERTVDHIPLNFDRQAHAELDKLFVGHLALLNVVAGRHVAPCTVPAGLLFAITAR